MSQCNPKCPFCDGAPKEGEDIIKLDWEHVISEGKKLMFAPFSSPSTKTQESGQALFDQIFGANRDLFGRPAPTYQAPRQSDRFFWVHKPCVEKAFMILRSVDLKAFGSSSR